MENPIGNTASLDDRINPYSFKRESMVLQVSRGVYDVCALIGDNGRSGMEPWR